MIIGSVGEVLPFVLVLVDGATTFFPQVNVYPADGTPVPLATLNLASVAEGYYYTSWPIPAVGKFVLVYTVYSDPARTVVATQYTKSDDLIFATQGPLGGAGGVVRQSFTLDVITNMIVVNTWLELGGGPIIPGVTNATLLLYNSAAGILATPPAQPAPVGQGVFRFSFANPGFPVGESATYAVATIDWAGPPAQTFRGVTGVTFSRST